MRLKQIRKSKGLTQEQLAKLLGCNQGVVQKIEKGITKLNTDWMRKIATALDCEPWQLLPEDMQPSFYHDLALQIDYGTMIYNEALQLHKQNKKVMDLVLQQAKVTNKLLEKHNKWVANEQN